MTDYTELIKKLRDLHRDPRPASAEWLFENQVALYDAAAAIEELQAQLPKRGEWIMCGPVGWPKWKCSVCHSEGRGDYIRCPWCGAVMHESNASNASNALNALDNAQDGPIITPCRGCSDYDGYGGCKSKGGCAVRRWRCYHDRVQIKGKI